MGVGTGLCMYDVVVEKFTFAISSPEEFFFSKEYNEVAFLRKGADRHEIPAKTSISKGDPCNMDRRVIWTTSVTTYQLLACYTAVFCDDVMLVS